MPAVNPSDSLNSGKYLYRGFHCRCKREDKTDKSVFMCLRSGLFLLIFLAPLDTPVNVALPLIAFGDGVPVLFRLLDAMFLHKSVNEIVLTLKDSIEAMQGVPHINVEAVAYASLQRLGRLRWQVEIVPRIFRAEVRKQDANEALATDLRHIIRRGCLQELFEQTPLHRAANEADGVIAALVVDKPLREIVFEFEVKVHIGFAIICKVTENSAHWQV